jgi:hypothetical protein
MSPRWIISISGIITVMVMLPMLHLCCYRIE